MCVCGEGEACVWEGGGFIAEDCKDCMDCTLFLASIQTDNNQKYSICEIKK